MTLEEMQVKLTEIQNDKFETKLLNVVLSIYAEIKAQENAIVELQNKINEIVNVLNGNAAATNPEEDALVNEPAPQTLEDNK